MTKTSKPNGPIQNNKYNCFEDDKAFDDFIKEAMNEPGTMVEPEVIIVRPRKKR